MRAGSQKDLRQAQEILDTDHYGLERVKDRIPEYRGAEPGEQNHGPILVWWDRWG